MRSNAPASSGCAWFHGFALPSANERVHRAAVDRAGPDQRDLDDEVEELAWPQPREGSQLRAGFDLKHPNRVRAAQHVEDLRVGEVEVGEVDLAAFEVADEVAAGPWGLRAAAVRTASGMSRRR